MFISFILLEILNNSKHILDNEIEVEIPTPQDVNCNLEVSKITQISPLNFFYYTNDSNN